jgi:hypothetical protein
LPGSVRACQEVSHVLGGLTRFVTERPGVSQTVLAKLSDKLSNPEGSPSSDNLEAHLDSIGANDRVSSERSQSVSRVGQHTEWSQTRIG